MSLTCHVELGGLYLFSRVWYICELSLDATQDFFFWLYIYHICIYIIDLHGMLYDTSKCRAICDMIAFFFFLNQVV